MTTTLRRLVRQGLYWQGAESHEIANRVLRSNSLHKNSFCTGNIPHPSRLEHHGGPHRRTRYLQSAPTSLGHMWRRFHHDAGDGFLVKRIVVARSPEFLAEPRASFGTVGRRARQWDRHGGRGPCGGRAQVSRSHTTGREASHLESKHRGPNVCGSAAWLHSQRGGHSSLRG